MSNSTESILTEAHDLIEQDRIDDAQELLRPLKQSEADNPDFWWVYLHAIRDPEEAQNALDQLTRLDAEYPGVETLRASGKPQTPGIQRLGSSSTLLDDFDDDNWPEDDFDDLELEASPTSEKPSNRRSLLLRLGALAAIILVVIVAFILLTGGGNDTTSEGEPTSIAQGVATSTQSLIPTVDESTEDVSITDEVVTEEAVSTITEEEPTSTQSLIPTLDESTENAVVVSTITDTPLIETATSEPTSTSTPQATNTPLPPALTEVFAQFQLSSNSFQIINDVDLGRVFAVNVCSQQDTPLRQTLNDAMTLLANQRAVAPNDVNSLAVALFNCDLGQPINVVGMPVDAARAFAAGEITVDQFLRQWRAIGTSQ